jgi:hypothetical protein
MERLPKRNPERNTKAEPGFIKRRSKISGQWSARLIEMLESPAYRVLTLSAHRVIDRIAIELAHHGGNDNGRLPVTKEDFMAYGIHHDGIAPAIREAEALGFIRVTERGRGGNAEHRKPHLFFLTFANSRSGLAPTHDWRKIKTLEDAMEIAKGARANKDSQAVKFAKHRTQKTESRSWKPGLVPVLETGTENPNSPVLETRTTGSGRKPGPLSIYGVGRAIVYAGSNPSPRYPIARPTQPYAGYGSLPIELRMLALGLAMSNGQG